MANVSTWEFIVGFLYILGGLGIFLFGMRVMSEGIQKVAGEGMRRIMATMTQNRFFGLGTGLLVTCLVQSSSATTVMVVSFVNAQLLTLTESIGVIMGANLGTTLTGWIIATIGKFSLSKIALPIIGIGLPLVFMSKPKFKHTGEFLVGFGLLFFGLSELKNAVPDVKSLLKSADPGDQLLVQDIQGFIQQLNSYGFGSVIIFLIIGVFLTILVQSSSAAMGITIIVAINGWINFEIAAAIVLGENIGTTVTAWLASLGANINAKRAARAHFIFNIVGVCWMLLLFYPFIGMLDEIMPGAIYIDDVTQADATAYLSDNEFEGVPKEEDLAKAKKAIVDRNIPLHLSLFHTLFNLANIALLIGFAPQLSRLAERLVKPKTHDGKAPKPGSLASLHYEGSGVLPKTGELNLALVEAEIDRLAAISRYMFEGFVEVFESPDIDKSDLIKELKELENKCDELAFDVTQSLIYCTTESLAGERALRVASLLRVTGELEDIGDCCHRLVQLAHRKYRKNRVLPQETLREIKVFSEQILDFMELYQTHLKDGSIPKIQKAEEIEDRIDASRKSLRKNAVKRMQDKENLKAEMIYVDILNEMERIGNDSLNIVQALNNVI
ncbi:MAG: Na/Pi cotransporter family protein [Opitutae bacterium]|jgi:phosphate:Na+ symporter|nr:Na/Pi cotransporter family protein [Opitutae bacterium]MBT5914711.1 Na/Pi cotransporter family protein [Opitutae bacterium]MBT7405771.1 Na/Pi cotransporter family protein [Opitutae bacterium]